jgi:hypothetical protein
MEFQINSVFNFVVAKQVNHRIRNTFLDSRPKMMEAKRALSAFEGIGGEYLVSPKNSDRLFTRPGFEGNLGISPQINRRGFPYRITFKKISPQIFFILLYF